MYDWQTNRQIVDAGRSTAVGRRGLAERRAVHVSPSYMPEYTLGLGQRGRAEEIDYWLGLLRTEVITPNEFVGRVLSRVPAPHSAVEANLILQAAEFGVTEDMLDALLARPPGEAPPGEAPVRKRVPWYVWALGGLAVVGVGTAIIVGARRR